MDSTKPDFIYKQALTSSSSSKQKEVASYSSSKQKEVASYSSSKQKDVASYSSSKQKEVASSSLKQKEVASSSSSSKKVIESLSKTGLPPRVVLNPADSDLDFIIERDGLSGYGLHEGAFSYCWSGARANVGITRGRYCFGCKLVFIQPVLMIDIARPNWHLCHVGISRGDKAIASLSETKTKLSIRGKIPRDRFPLTFWTDFDVGQTIICCVDLENKSKPLIGFFQNGLILSCDSCEPDVVRGSAVFPHVLLKNVMVEMQFSVEDGLIPLGGFKPWSMAIADGNSVMGPTMLTHPSDCEVIMMVGIPDSGKTTWAKKAVKDYPEKNYLLLGIDSILHDKMKIPLQRNNHIDYTMFDHRAIEIFYRMLQMAPTIPRNYIIDNRRNVYLNFRKDTLKSFADYRKIAVVVVPEFGEYCIRSFRKHQETTILEPMAISKELTANFVMPKSKDMPDTDEYFDEVIYAEQQREEAQNELDYLRGVRRS